MLKCRFREAGLKNQSSPRGRAEMKGDIWECTGTEEIETSSLECVSWKIVEGEEGQVSILYNRG